ncbi:MAG: HD domain-containing phosphohydrolase [Campylobacterota bacterium]
MNKKKEILFNLNNFLLSVSKALEYVEKEFFDVELGHNKRVAYVTLKIANELGLSHEDKYDLCAYALCNNIALKKVKEQTKQYCLLSEELIQPFPFLKKKENILKYQFEYFNQTGLYKLKIDEIPLFSQIICFAKTLDSKYDLQKDEPKNKELIREFVQCNKDKLFSKTICEAYLNASRNLEFYLDLQNENQILYFIFSNLVDYSSALSFEEIFKITSVFDRLINEDNSLPNSVEKMANFYGFEHKDSYTLKIASSLVSIGKLCINDTILNKNDSLDKYEYEKIKEYPYHTKVMLSNIIGFNDIAKWASCIQERLDGSGYPSGLDAKTLSLKERLLINLVIYEALKSSKYYKNSLTHGEAIDLMKKEFNKSHIDLTILDDINEILK